MKHLALTVLGLILSFVIHAVASDEATKALSAFLPSIYSSAIGMASIFLAVKYFFITTVKEKMIDSLEYQNWHRERFNGYPDYTSIPALCNSITHSIYFSLAVSLVQVVAIISPSGIAVSIAVGMSIPMVVYFISVLRASKYLTDLYIDFGKHQIRRKLEEHDAQNAREENKDQQ